MSYTEYVISSFPPIANDEVHKHIQLNRELESRSRTEPEIVHKVLQKLNVQRKLLQKSKQDEQKHVKQKNKKLQLKTRLTREDVFMDRPETPPRAPKPPKIEKPKYKKIIQSFRYSRAITEYYKAQLDPKDRPNLETIDNDNDTVSNAGTCIDETVNGWIIKPLGPQVLNLRARTMSSCNPIEMRLRRKREIELAKLSKKSSNLSVVNARNSRKVSTSSDLFCGYVRNRDSQNNAFINNVGGWLPNISEATNFDRKDRVPIRCFGTSEIKLPALN